MNEQPRSAVCFEDGKPQFELAASELVFRVETGKANAPIYFHMRPYTAEGIKKALRALKPKMKDTGATILAEEGDQTALLPLFDECFVRMANVRLSATDNDEPSIERQRAWLDRNPR